MQGLSVNNAGYLQFENLWLHKLEFPSLELNLTTSGFFPIRVLERWAHHVLNSEHNLWRYTLTPCTQFVLCCGHHNNDRGSSYYMKLLILEVWRAYIWSMKLKSRTMFIYHILIEFYEIMKSFRTAAATLVRVFH